MSLQLSSFLLLTFMIFHHGYAMNGEDEWVKMNSHDVCFGTRDDQYGSFQNNAKEGMVVAIKLVYLRGYVRNGPGAVRNSRWGGNIRSLAQGSLNVIVTDQNNLVLFPRKELITLADYMWYNLPFADTKSSNELVFTDYAHPFYFPLKKQMKIWYGEDLVNKTEHDNAGRVCVDVYAKFIEMNQSIIN